MKQKNELRNRILTILLLSGFYMGAFGIEIANAFTNTVSVTGSVTVPGNCIFSANVAAVNFGSVAIGTNTMTQNSIAVSDGGNVGSNILTSGTDWTWASNTFLVENTFYSNTINQGLSSGISARLTGGSVDTKIPVNLVAANIIYFGVAVPAGQAAGTYTQTISLISSC